MATAKRDNPTDRTSFGYEFCMVRGGVFADWIMIKSVDAIIEGLDPNFYEGYLKAQLEQETK